MGRKILTKKTIWKQSKAFYRELDQEEERCDDDQLVAEESKQFWRNIWSQSADNKKDVKRLQNLRSEVNVKKQDKIDIIIESLKILGTKPNWKSSDPDLVQGFWLENFSSLRKRVRLQLKESLDSGFVPRWLTRGRPSLLQKYKSEGNVASNYRL